MSASRSKTSSRWTESARQRGSMPWGWNAPARAGCCWMPKRAWSRPMRRSHSFGRNIAVRLCAPASVYWAWTLAPSASWQVRRRRWHRTAHCRHDRCCYAKNRMSKRC
ncbi:MYXO-CTERM sorting domain-containing protein [Novosphingobium sp. BL-8H]|uniref:MYXO-CTERM sorting domain-containing protein n=1 Tax=Novosphingobium sp. BL-8H TaxID=3127640 RepID=UPI00375653BB